MRAGREMDARIARDVMGLLVFQEPPFDVNPVLLNADEVIIGVVPSYSTDISAAWLVVEQMKARGIRVALIAYLDGTYGCELRNEGTAFVTREESDTPAHAICLAALKALGL